MTLLLKIIGIVALVIVVLVILGVLWLWRTFKAMIKSQADAHPPCRVTLEPEDNPLWRSERTILDLASEFRAAGFEQIGVFTIPEMSNLQFLAFVHITEKFYGCLYDHQKLEPTFEIIADFADDSGLAGTSTTLGAELEQRPGCVTIRKDGASVVEIFEAVRQHPKAAERLPLTREGFVENFKKGYAISMNWRLKKGGVSKEEIKRQAARDGQKITDEQVDEVYVEMREGYVCQLKQGCLAQYLDEQKMVASEWERVQDRTFAIPETLDVKEVIEAIEEAMTLDEEQRHVLEKVRTAFGENAVHVVERILSENIGALGLRKLAEVKEPVPAFIMLAPDRNYVPEKLAA